MTERIKKAIDANAEVILKKKNVFGIGEAEKQRAGKKTGKKGITVFVEAKVTKDRIKEEDMIPKSLDGVQTDVIALDRPVPLPLPVDLHEGWEDKTYGWRRPFMIGDEIGAVRLAQAGTLGMITRIENYGDVGLTNFHVIHSAMNEDLDLTGWKVSQAAYDWSGQPRKEEIGEVFQNSRLNPAYDFNKTDACFFRLTNPGGNPKPGNPGVNAPGSHWDKQVDFLMRYAGFQGYKPSLLGWPHYHENYCALVRDIKMPEGYRPQPAGLGVVEVGDRVWKSGRTTGITNGTVLATNFHCTVNYGGLLGQVKFNEQIMVMHDSDFTDPSRIVGPGDSGSLVIDAQNNAVGLLFAGATSWYVANRIQNVFELLLPGIGKRYDMNREEVSYG